MTSWLLFFLSFVLSCGLGSFKSVCVLMGMIYLGLIISFLVFRGGLCRFDIGLRDLRLVSVVGGACFCDVSVDVFLIFFFFLVFFWAYVWCWH